MSEQPVAWDSEEATIRRPEPTPAALRDALTRLAPSQIPEFDRRLREASTQALTGESIGPLWLFCRSWAQFIEVERHPAVARRQNELLALVDSGSPDAKEAIAEISRIRAWVDAKLDE
ncbi:MULTISPECIES: hypothetical protein [unclassified Nocardiopsis]|uniref:hypothetical protein n=1 Tax=Nocardiopsis TaxID=2013 RepID=UPI00387AF28C